jgi:uncharacterized BrkB/YihY/UPF0761 family membrane protein
MIWMWMSAIVVLFGAELNSEIEHQTAADSTEGGGNRLEHAGPKLQTLLEKQKPEGSTPLKEPAPSGGTLLSYVKGGG